MGGDIMVESELGKGKTFKPCQPADDPAIVPLPDNRKSQPGRETLLVVEDDDSVREFTVRMLNILGYSVLSAPDGHKALELFKSQASQIDMVITDMVMPNMTGKQFVEAIRQLDKNMKIMFVSGYGAEDALDGMTLDPSVAFFQKPYTRDQFSKKIREVLDGKKS
jgi:two-component system cell cycle sensor histidine kinase/response regulator CckA